MEQVNVFIVGAAKSGTTSLVDYLSMSESVFAPKMKEPFYFIDDDRVGLSNFNEYASLYSGAECCSIRLDASTGYLFSQDACNKIKDYNSNAKIIILLRNPVDMAYSLWSYMRTNGVERREFKQAFLAQSVPSCFSGQNWVDNYLYMERAKYSVQVERYLNEFKNVKVVIFEELVSDSEITLGSICAFLGMQDVLPKVLPASNAGGAARFSVLAKLRNRRYPMLKAIVPPGVRAEIRRLSRELNTSRGKSRKITAEERALVAEKLAEDVKILERSGIDTSYWLDFK